MKMADKPYKASKDLFRGAMILSIAAIIVKVLSAVYRVPYQNIVGDIGFYIYQQVYPFYGVVLTLSTLGFPIIISKLIAEKRFSQKDILVASLLVLSFIAFGMFLILFLGADWIANKMGDEHLSSLLKTVSFYYLFMPLAAILRGYFQGHQNMIPTAISQVAEQLVRVLAILVLTPFLIYQGSSLYDAGNGAVFGSVLGGIMGLILLVAFFIWMKERKLVLHNKLHIRQFPIIMKVLLFQGFAFCISSLILVLFQLIDSLHLFSLLKQSGISDEIAKQLKGVYDRGQPLLQLGTLVANSLSLVLVPLISSYVKKGLHEEMISKVSLVMRVSFTVGVAASFGLISIMESINQMLFTDTRGSMTLAIFSLSIIFSSLIMTLTAVIQSLGSYVAPVIIVLAGLAAKWFFDIWLIPYFHISGAAISTVLSFFGMTMGFYLVLKHYLKQSVLSKKDVWTIIRIALFMGIALFLFNTIFEWVFPIKSRLAATLQALLAVVLGACIFIIQILRANLFKQEELVLLPFGYKLVNHQKWRRNKKHA